MNDKKEIISIIHVDRACFIEIFNNMKYYLQLKY